MYTTAEKEALYKFKEEFKSLKDPFQISKKDSMYFEFAFKIKVRHYLLLYFFYYRYLRPIFY